MNLCLYCYDLVVFTGTEIKKPSFGVATNHHVGIRCDRLIKKGGCIIFLLRKAFPYKKTVQLFVKNCFKNCSTSRKLLRGYNMQFEAKWMNLWVLCWLLHFRLMPASQSHERFFTADRHLLLVGHFNLQDDVSLQILLNINKCVDTLSVPAEPRLMP